MEKPLVKNAPNKTVPECLSLGRWAHVVATNFDAIIFYILSDKELTCQKIQCL